MRVQNFTMTLLCAAGLAGCGLAADLNRLNGGGDGGSNNNNGGGSSTGSCANGVLDGDETDVDCGGSCVACAQVSGPPFWQPIASVPTTRTAFGVAVGGDGRIYTIGGQTNGSGYGSNGQQQHPLSAVVEVYDPATDKWSKAGSLSQPRCLLGASMARDGRVYAMSGKNSQGLTNLVEVYDLKTSAWTKVSDIPTRRAFFGATTGLDGRIYAAGGDNFQHDNALAAFESYAPDTDTWTTLPPLPTARTNLGVATWRDGRILALGGDDNDHVFDAAEIYDPAKNSWSKISALPTARSGLTAVAAPDGRVWAIGGSGSRVDVYTLATDHWASAPNLLHARDTMGSTIGPDGRIYVFGGDDAGTAEVYGPKIAVTPTSGVPNSAAIVNGSNFAAKAHVSVFLDARDSVAIGTGVTDEHGALTMAIRVTIPNADPTTGHVLVVVDDRSRYPVTTAFAVR